MAKRATTQPTARKSRLTDDQIRGKDMNPFLHPEHTNNGEAFKLTGWVRQSPAKDQIIIEVESEAGLLFDLGVREGSPDHRKLFKALGADWRTWRGGIIVSVVPGRNPGTSFVNVAAADHAEPF